MSSKTKSANQQSRSVIVSELLKRLDEHWMPPEWIPSGKPVDELVGTILSQNTSDTNTHRAFQSLRSAFPNWTDVVTAPVSDIVEAIRPGGLAEQKAPRIQRALAQVMDPDAADPNEALLRRLSNMNVQEAISWLTSMQGVGPKTAACVLLFAAGKPVVPVDTHVFRVSSRIGLIDAGIDANRAHAELLQVVPPDDTFRFHMHLIHHGRTVCKARNPRCLECPVQSLCEYRARQQTAQT